MVDNGKFFDLGGEINAVLKVEGEENKDSINEIGIGNFGVNAENHEKGVNFAEKTGEFNWPTEELKENFNQELENQIKSSFKDPEPEDFQVPSNEPKEKFNETKQNLSMDSEKAPLNEFNKSENIENLDQYGIISESKIQSVQTKIFPDNSEVLLTSTKPDLEKY